MLRRINIVDNPNIGVFILATDDLAIVPYNLLDEKVKLIEETLEVEAVKSSISGCNLIGSLAVANSNGIVVSPHVLDREVKVEAEIIFSSIMLYPIRKILIIAKVNKIIFLFFILPP